MTEDQKLFDACREYLQRAGWAEMSAPKFFIFSDINDIGTKVFLDKSEPDKGGTLFEAIASIEAARARRKVVRAVGDIKREKAHE